ncbi:hypothetical protein CC86DRAFT_414307 [Ophiobolus disseminans]|uniref:DNA2/NAM7 helicase helicase domain-containing protein n=1 Tax=Ophiobolus disseminans TaxID=1469910 RepID=A0A6A7AJ79_9PLEO|nr:hypothetical protein CC86DRAFT_414307 [Ophiobolus disseminans]
MMMESDGTTWFKGRFRKLGKKSYAVEVFLVLEAKLNNRAIQMPKPGNRIHLEIDLNNAARPSKKNVANMVGTVIYDALETSAPFICMVSVTDCDLHNLDNDMTYITFVGYIVDKTPHRSMLEGIAQLQAYTAKDFGPDSRRKIFDYRTSASNTHILRTSLAPGSLKRFQKMLRQPSFALNVSHTRAAKMTLVSASGNVSLLGSLGTGKAGIVAKGVCGHLALGHRVMCTAPMNTDVRTMVEQFLATQEKLSAVQRLISHQWAIFTGAIVKRRNLSKLSGLEHDDAALIKADNKIVRYLQNSRGRTHFPNIEETVAFKLMERVEEWSTDARFEKQENLHSRTKLYKETKAKLPFMDPAHRKQAKIHISAEEENFAHIFLKELKYLFCTVSTASPPLLQESGTWDVLIIDEAARETRACLAVALGSLVGRVKLIWMKQELKKHGQKPIGKNTHKTPPKDITVAGIAKPKKKKERITKGRRSKKPKIRSNGSDDDSDDSSGGVPLDSGDFIKESAGTSAHLD